MDCVHVFEKTLPSQFPECRGVLSIVPLVERNGLEASYSALNES